MATLKDIAKECGVSIATVSKALNDQSDIGQETAARIKEIALEMGYKPNGVAKALRTSKTKSLGVLFADEAHSGLKHDFFAAVLDSFKNAAEEQGYDITFVNSCHDYKNRLTYTEHCRYRSFDGVALACVDFTDPEVIELARSEIPTITIDYIFDNCTAIVSDNVQGMSELFDFIYERGHRKIAYIHGLSSSVTTNRLSSFYREAAEKNVTIPDKYVLEAPYRDTKEAYRITKNFLKMQDPPTCIIYQDDYAAIGGMNAIREAGLRVGEDIGVAGYDGIASLKPFEPRLATVEQDTERIGRTAAEELIKQIEKPKTTFVRQIKIPGRLERGGSVPKVV